MSTFHPVISILLAARIDKKIANLDRLLQSIVSNASNTNNIEVCIKFDDDQDLTLALDILDKYKNTLQIKYHITPRGKGYQGYTYFMNDLMFLTNQESEIISFISIDFHFIAKNFDTIIIESSKTFDDKYFVLHSRHFPDFKNTVRTLNLACQDVDSGPMISRRWVETQMTFGYNALGDGFLSMIEWFLYKDYNIDRRIDIVKHRILEETHSGGFVDSDYWQGPRKTSMQIHLHPQSVAFAKQAACNLALNISSNISPKLLSKDEYYKCLIESCLDSYDKMLLLTRDGVTK